MRGNKVLPFYMTYPLPMAYEDEDAMLRDLDYLQQMYPQDAKKYQKKIVAILDKMDYEGSMIYDDYPDQFMLYKLSRDITEMIRKDAAADNEEELSPEYWKQIGDLVQVLLFYEIYKRRHDSGRGILKFF
ncbi:MAG: hypothetical protein J6K26_11050 [Lachnospiraceae bacterium]|nr:hypothetical protein [Lachnospiraceae bacterium]